MTMSDSRGIQQSMRRQQRSRSLRVNYKKLAGEEDSAEDEFSEKNNKLTDDILKDEKFASIKTYKRKSTDTFGYYGNKHVELIVNNNFDDISSILQICSDGTKLTAQALHEGVLFNINNPILIKDTPASLGMTMPKVLSVRDIAQCIGFSFPINVMDVSTQEELPDWTLKDLMVYFECPLRKKKMADYHKSVLINNESNVEDRQEKQKCKDSKIPPKILNQISLEFSRTPLVRRVQSPKFVRDIDWIDNAWPQNRKQLNEYPQVQYYCLTSTAGCYTDFHTDFGGTSVWYHVISGKKVFLLIPPTEENLKNYEEWICSQHQGNIFFANLVKGCYKVELEAGKTLIIPTGWIHAVYTPIDSVVIGGNFLHSLNIKGQLDIHCIETRTNVPQKFCFPFFRQINFYAASVLLQKLRNGELNKLEKKGLPSLIEALKLWNVSPGGDAEIRGSISEVATYAARLSKCTYPASMIEELESVLEMGSLIETKSSTSKNVVPSKPLKLKLSMKQSSSSSSKEDTALDIKVSSKFQIFVPKEPVFSINLNKKVAKHKQCDLSYTIDNADDEWIPGSKRRKKRMRAATESASMNMKNYSPAEVTASSDNTLVSETDVKQVGTNTAIKRTHSVPANIVPSGKKTLQFSTTKVKQFKTNAISKHTIKQSVLKKNQGSVRERLKKRFAR